MEAIQVSINGLIDKQNVVSTQNGILFNFKKEWTLNTCYKNTEEPQKHSGK